MLTIYYIGCGIYFRQASYILNATAIHTCLHKVRGARKNDVAKFVQAVLGINLQDIAYLLNHDEAWEFYIDFDGETAQGR